MSPKRTSKWSRSVAAFYRGRCEGRAQMRRELARRDQLAAMTIAFLASALCVVSCVAGTP